MQVINDTNFGGELGKALGGGLRDLAQYKLQSLQEPYQRMLQQRRAVEGTRQIFGDQGAQFYASLDPNAQKEFLKNPLPFLKLLQAGGLDNLGGGMQQLMQGQQGQIPLPGGQQPSQPGQPIPNTGVLSPALLEQIQRQQQGQGDQSGQQDRFAELDNLFQTPEQKLNKLKAFQPQFQKIKEKAEADRALVNDAQQALKVLRTNKAKTGVWGKITPGFLQSQEGQLLTKLLNDIVIKKANAGIGGRGASQLRLQLEKGSKADIWNHPKVIEQILTGLVNDPETQRRIAEGTALSELEEKYAGAIPEDIIPRINKRSKEILGSRASSQPSAAERLTKQSLPDASSLSNGQKARNPDTGKIEYIVKNGKWEEYNG
jgi:hypothetical protein